MKEEPVSSTNVDEQKSEERAENGNVIVKQRPPSNDFENDPEAGPSGLQTEAALSNTNVGRRLLQYQSDSDDDSEDECASAMWRPQESYRFNRNEDDSGDTRFSNQSWRYDPPMPTNDAPVINDNAPSTSNQNDDIIDLSENESNQSNAPPSNARSLEVLTAPDLQLDWTSDSSSDNEIVCTIRSHMPSDRSHNTALNLSQSNLNGAQASNDEPVIDLTVSDVEDYHHTRNTTRPTIVSSRSSELSRGFMNHHYRMSNMYYNRCRRPLRSPNFCSESRNER